MMKAIILERYGKKGRMRLGDMPEPELADNEVLVQVHAAGVNPLDGKIKSGEFKLLLPYRFPLVLGHDVAGVVLRVGGRVKKFKPGDEVYSRPDDFRIGAFAELIAIKEDSLAIKPKSLSMEQAASIPLVGLTAWQVLVETAKLKKGAKDFHSGRLRRRRDNCDPVGETSRCVRGDDDEHGQCGVGKEPRCRCRYRLQEG